MPEIPGIDLIAYLDWPTDVTEEGVWCNAAGCESGDCGRGYRTWLCRRTDLTGRMFLTAVKAHAEGRPVPGR